MMRLRSAPFAMEFMHEAKSATAPAPHRNFASVLSVKFSSQIRPAVFPVAHWNGAPSVNKRALCQIAPPHQRARGKNCGNFDSLGQGSGLLRGGFIAPAATR